MFNFTRFKKSIILLASLLIIIGVFTGCGEKADVIKVGSKEFSEQLILGQITLLALQDAGYKVEDKTNIAGSDKVRSALENGNIDVYWEYTGTAWLMHLQNDEAITDSEECYIKVKEEDAKKDLIWMNYAPLNNTYTVMMTQAASDNLGVTTISELADYINQNPEELIFAGDHEFTGRPDGMVALEEAYGFSFGENQVKEMGMGIIYKTLQEEQVEVGMGFATDGRIAAYDLVNLEDDRNFFPVYNAAPVFRKETFEKHPELSSVLDPIIERLDTETITQLNYQVDIEEKEPKEVAREWLQSEGLIK
ncbi:MAG: glycine betaine ABC transporter substrate-binding protein [Epulopiscium sp.]|nr:glycine betaine ABC transporter substrate-binding protein [Candidatus Epulonipiscium sp.]